MFCHHTVRDFFAKSSTHRSTTTIFAGFGFVLFCKLKKPMRRDRIETIKDIKTKLKNVLKYTGKKYFSNVSSTIKVRFLYLLFLYSIGFYLNKMITIIQINKKLCLYVDKNDNTL